MRRPTLRILLLAAFGAVVYLKFDSFVSSPFFKVLGHPRLMRQAFSNAFKTRSESPAHETMTAGPAPSLQWSADSARLSLDCASAETEPCLEAWSGLGPDAIGSLRALIDKAGIKWGIIPASGFTADFTRTLRAPEGTGGLRLVKLELRNTKGTVTLEARGMDDAVRFCGAERCLDEPAPRPPFPRFRNPGIVPERSPETVMEPVGSAVFHPVLRGRIVEILSDPKRVEIYHGGNTFSFYGGFSGLRPGLRAGSLVNMDDTLGFVAREGDSLGSLNLRIEKDGIRVDPLAFLGIEPDSGGPAHGR